MRKLTLTLLTIGLISAAGQAPAQTYDPAFPVCMRVVPLGGGWYYDCSYQTMPQCAASASGRAAQCFLNPYFAGPIRRAPRYRQAVPLAAPPAIQSRFCLQGRQWGYPGNCQFSSYAQCMATAYGTDAYCGQNPQYTFAAPRTGTYR